MKQQPTQPVHVAERIVRGEQVALKEGRKPDRGEGTEYRSARINLVFIFQNRVTNRPAVEAFPIHRAGNARDYFVVPIDVCFGLAGLIRKNWPDDFSRRILERTGGMGPDNLAKLHGVTQKTELSNCEFFNPSRPAESAWTHGVELKPGDLVIICPKRGADAIDLMLAGKTAVIEAIEQDAGEQIHLALVLTDDPGFDFGLARQSGYGFFYGLDEVKPLKTEVSA